MHEQPSASRGMQRQALQKLQLNGAAVIQAPAALQLLLQMPLQMPLHVAGERDGAAGRQLHDFVQRTPCTRLVIDIIAQQKELVPARLVGGRLQQPASLGGEAMDVGQREYSGHEDQLASSMG